MKVEKTTSATGQWGLCAVPEDYDGTPPLPVVQFDRQPRTLSPDRVALASYLLFGPWISGRFTSPQWHSPALSQAIVEDARPAWIQTEPVELYAKALPKGRRSVTVVLEGDAATDALTVGRAGPSLSLLRSDRSVGARLGAGALELSTNAWLMARDGQASRRRRVVAACGVLFAEDLDADEIVLPSAGTHGDASLEHLLAGARLGLRLLP